MKIRKVIIFAGVKSPTWDKEAKELAKVLEKEGMIVLEIIPINGLDCPKVEYIKF